MPPQSQPPFRISTQRTVENARRAEGEVEAWEFQNRIGIGVKLEARAGEKERRSVEVMSLIERGERHRRYARLDPPAIVSLARKNRYRQRRIEDAMRVRRARQNRRGDAAERDGVATIVLEPRGDA